MRSPAPPRSPAAPAGSPFAASGGSVFASGVRDAESLFRTKPIAEIRSLEAATRREIDEKKEDLRQLVGQSYRDLIDSADSILLMRSSCISLSSLLSSTDSALLSLASSAESALSGPTAASAAAVHPGSSRARVYDVASRVKYLVDSPENIWGILDESMLLEASGRYLRARVVHGLISAERDTLSRFPLLRHQWQIIESFRPQISQRSRERLTDRDLLVGAYADALAAAATIDDLDPMQVLSLFLGSRRSWISQKLAGAPFDADASASVLCDAMKIIRATLAQVGQIFVHATSEMPLFYKMVLGSPPGTQLFGGISNPEEEVKLWKLHREKLESVMIPLEPEFIAETCSSWLKGCCDEIFGDQSGGKQLIDAIGTGEQLASTEKMIRDALDGREGLEEGLEQWLISVFGSEIKSSWDQLCGLIMKDKKDILEDRLEVALVKRMKQIVDLEFEILCRDINVRKSVEAIGVIDVHPEDGNEVPIYLKKLSTGGSAWFSEPNQKKTGMMFAFKSMVEENDFRSCLNSYFGTEVSRIRDVLDSNCRNILEDLLCFIESHNSTLRIKDLAPYLQENCYGTISSIMKELEEEIGKLSTSLESSKKDRDSLSPSTVVERSLFIGRLSFAFRNYSSQIPLILGSPRQWVKEKSGATSSNPPPSPLPRQSKVSFQSPVSFSPRRHSYDSPRREFIDSPRRQTISAATALFAVDDVINPRLDELNKALRNLSIKAHNLWIIWVAKELSIIFTRDLNEDDGLSASIPLQGWEVTVVKQEESKEGQLEITISLPSMPSLYVTSFLFQACLEIHKVGGHILDRLILQKLSWELLKKVIDIYERFLATMESGESQVSEKGVLQMLLDLQFLADILSGGKDSALSGPEADPEASSRFTTLKSSFRRKQPQLHHVSTNVESVIRLRNRLSQKLDPIDWATFEPYLWENEKQSYKRYAVLFGFLVQLNHMYTETIQKLPTKSNTGSNIMRCSTIPRFKYLPISAPALSTRIPNKSVLQSSTDETPVRSPWKSYSNEQSPKADFDDSLNFGVAAPLLKSFMTQVGSKLGEGTSMWGSMLSDGQVGKLKDRSAAAMSTFGDMLPVPAAGLLSSLTSGTSRYES